MCQVGVADVAGHVCRLSCWLCEEDPRDLGSWPLDVDERLVLERHDLVREFNDLPWTPLTLIHSHIDDRYSNELGDGRQSVLRIAPERIDGLFSIPDGNELTANGPKAGNHSCLGLCEILEFID